MLRRASGIVFRTMSGLCTLEHKNIIKKKTTDVLQSLRSSHAELAGLTKSCREHPTAREPFATSEFRRASGEGLWRIRGKLEPSAGCTSAPGMPKSKLKLFALTQERRAYPTTN